MHSRSLETLNKAIKDAEERGLKQQLGLQIGMAKQLRDQLQKLQDNIHEVLKMEKKTYTEIRKYPNPPTTVHKIMMATLILVGESPNTVQVYTALLFIVCKRNLLNTYNILTVTDI